MGSEIAQLKRRASALDAAGDWHEASLVYSRVVAEALASGDIQEVVSALRREAHVRYNGGFCEEAHELAILCFEIAERAQLQSAAARALNLLAFISHSSGDHQQAELLYGDALIRARELGDSELVAGVCQNLGVLANLRGDLKEARALYLESVGSIVRADDRSNAMVAYNNLGIVCTDLGEWLEAEIYFGRGIEIAEQLGAKSMLVKLRINSAEPFIQVGEFVQARAALGLAEALARDVKDESGLSDAHRYRARMARIEGDYVAAEEHLDQAIALAEEHELELERGEALEELALLRRAEGRGGASRMTAREALRVFEGLGARRDAERVRRFLAERPAEDPDSTSPAAAPVAPGARSG